mgnify:FL=1
MSKAQLPPNCPAAQPEGVCPSEPKNEEASAFKAIFELLASPDQRLEVTTVHGHTVAAQVAELTMAMKSMKAEIPELMARGIVSAVGNPETWTAAKKAMRKEAQDVAGNWLMGIIKFALDKVMWGALFLVAVYWVGGMPALVGLLKLKASAP